MYGDNDFKTIVGKTVKSIRMDSDYAILMFDNGTYQTFAVEGDCCSYSYFTDFVRWLDVYDGRLSRYS